MKVLLLGGTGFIGKHIHNELKNSHELLSFKYKIDFMNLPTHQKLAEILECVDVVINAVGIIAETKTKTFEQIHTLAPIALFDACKEAGVKKVFTSLHWERKREQLPIIVLKIEPMSI